MRGKHFAVDRPRLCNRLTAPGGVYREDLRRDEKSGGIAMKITNSADGLYSGDPQQVFAYNIDGDKVWYDLSTVFGEPFLGDRLEVTSTTGESIIWPKGSNPGGSQVKVAPNEENVWFTVYAAT
ncbi:hypothetical protein J1614_003420 [Plenodomus biglobosus]|nr:hypothetical protein J1614_003420 [Plenodomus biglobosus]